LRSDVGQLGGMKGRKRILSADNRLTDTNQTAREGSGIFIRNQKVRDPFFQCVNDSGRTDLQYPCCVVDTAAIKPHVYALLFDGGGTSFGEEIKLTAGMRTVGMLALRALLPRCGLAAGDDLAARTVGTEHGKAYHYLRLQQKA